jgi:hypothetical protein
LRLQWRATIEFDAALAAIVGPAFSLHAIPRSISTPTNYLAANPDVKTAQINPLEHFLLQGIDEHRSAQADGVWGKSRTRALADECEPAFTSDRAILTATVPFS